MQAIILAAGMGKRLKDLTRDNTKCMVKVNGVPLIKRMLQQLDKLSVSRIVIVLGYESQKLIDYVATLNINSTIEYVNNPIYYKTNNIYSLYLARGYLLKEDTLLLESDLIFEDSILKRIIDHPYPNLALVAKYESWMDGTVLTLDEDNNIKRFLGKKQFRFEDTNDYFKTVNIYKFSREFSTTHYVPFLEAYCKALGYNEYYEQVLKVIALLEKPEIKAAVLGNELWYEIDDAQDLDIAESIFTPSQEDKLLKFQNRYGGYWRYPGLIDFCYLVNPFYPTTRLLDEIKANFERLVSQYPSGLEVNCLLAAKYFSIRKEHIVVGNGAAELIKSFMEIQPGKVGIVRPTFEEYPNRSTEDQIIAFQPCNRDYSYDGADLIEFYRDKDIATLLLINPDNPSGNYVKKANSLELARWTRDKGIRLVVDESFIDFVSKESNASLLTEEMLKRYPNLIIVKSISKSFGVPGLRLGILASYDEDLIEHIRKDLSIWNINSFAEFYLQIFEKYRDDYSEALDQLKLTRKQYQDNLASVAHLRVIPSQANYVLCEVLDGYKATDLTKILLDRFGLFIKDLSTKKGIDGEYVRVAVKKPLENEKLVNALREILG